MSVIKQHSTRISTPCGAFDLTDLRRGAEDTLRTARTEADHIIAQAKMDAVQIVELERKRAQAEGFSLGLAKGEAEGRAAGVTAGQDAAHKDWAVRFEAIATSYVAELVRWQAVREERIHEAERDLAALAVMIAEKAARTAVAVDNTAVVRQAEAAIALVAHATMLLVRCHPDDYEILERELPALVAIVRGNPSVRLEQVESVGRGGVVLMTPEGTVDASLATQFRRIQEAIVGDLPRRSTPDRRAHGESSDEGHAS